MLFRPAPPLEIVVRCAPATSVASGPRRKTALELLGEDEAEKFERLRASSMREDYLAAHALARLTLADLAECAPERIVFRRARNGRPELARPWRARALHFSISHADRLVLCAVTRNSPVGADIESARNLGADPLGVAAAVCSEAEHNALLRLPRGARAERVLQVWTLKEAVAKASGQGVHLSLADIAFDVDDGDYTPGAFRAKATAADGSKWHAMWIHLTPDHLAAVAIPAARAEGATILFERAHIAEFFAQRRLA
jgi:4'-phosphopantetheinyl transferase